MMTLLVVAGLLRWLFVEWKAAKLEGVVDRMIPTLRRVIIP